MIVVLGHEAVAIVRRGHWDRVVSTLTVRGGLLSLLFFFPLLCFDQTHSSPAQMSDPSPSPGGTKAEGVRPDENRSSNPCVS